MSSRGHEPYILLTDPHRKVFNRFLALNEEQQNWVIDSKPTLKELVVRNECGDKDVITDDAFRSSRMQQPKNHPLNPYKRQLRIQDIERHGYLDTGGLVGGQGKMYDETLYNFYEMRMENMDTDWLTYPATQDPHFVAWEM